MEILEIPVKFAILAASISSVKYLRISLNFFSEIWGMDYMLIFHRQDHNSCACTLFEKNSFESF
jgi:hypothetical protein